MRKSLAIIVTLVILFSLLSLALAAMWMGKTAFTYNSPTQQSPTSSLNPKSTVFSTPNQLKTLTPTSTPTSPESTPPTAKSNPIPSPTADETSNATSLNTPTVQPTPTPTPNPNSPQSFSTDFSSGNFNSWAIQNQSIGANMSVINGDAHFSTPIGSNNTYSYVQKNGFTSTVNSVIVASQDIYLTALPQGFTTGNGAIFFLYVIDAVGQNNGNLAVGIDGSDVWGLWIGGFPIYNYGFQTAGASPQSTTWYHLVLTINNPAQTVTLAVNGTTVIRESQHQFTDTTHAVNLISGIAEVWNNETHELNVGNVELSISSSLVPTPTPP